MLDRIVVDIIDLIMEIAMFYLELAQIVDSLSIIP
jgi:hypothetical protein